MAKSSENKAKLIFLMITTAIIAICVIVYFTNPNGSTICPSRTLFGIYCSACGITRAVYSITHLNFAAAFNYNQFFVVSLPVYAYFYIAAALKIFLNKSILPKKKTVKIFIAVYFALFLLYGILRNTVLFNFLAPEV